MGEICKNGIAIVHVKFVERLSFTVLEAWKKSGVVPKLGLVQHYPGSVWAIFHHQQLSIRNKRHSWGGCLAKKQGSNLG